MNKMDEIEILKFGMKYPFSKLSKDILLKNEVDVSESIVNKAVYRIKSSLKRGYPKSIAIHKSDIINEIVSYATSRMLLSYMKNSYLINKFAVSESKRAYNYLSYESNEEETRELLSEFGFKLKNIWTNRDSYEILFSTYLKYSPGSIDYRLINREINGGYVKANKHEVYRLLQEAIRFKMIKIPIIKKASKEIMDGAESIIKELPKITPTKISFKKGDNPPCIESLLISLKKHQNLNHQARWALAVYLLNKKTTTEDILDLFSNFPDYNEKISKYQVEHAKKAGYITPSCSTMRGYGLCVSDCPIKNPLQWSKIYYKKDAKKEDTNE